MKRYYVTEVEMRRYSVLKSVIDGTITLRSASEVLGLSYRQAIRLKERLLTCGFEGLLRKTPLRPPNLKVTKELKDRIIQLREDLYGDFNILHFKDKLSECHGINLSHETLRQILIKEGLHSPKTKRKVYRRRRRMPKAGLLVQMDSSQHRWLEHIERPWWLVAMIDDADGYIYAEFHPKETTRANMEVIKAYIRQRGLFMALYTDKASHFKTIRHGGLHYNVQVEQKDTQIQRALKELGIELINANSPQAKGRIERLFRFFQDRLIKEMRLRGIKDYDEANRFLNEEFLPWYNKNYTYSVESAYKSLPEGIDLELVFSIKHPKKVNKDNTISYRGRIYQLLPNNGRKSFANLWVEVCELADGEIKILYEDKEFAYVVLTREAYRVQKEEEILSKREYVAEKKAKKKYHPPADHPWRQSWKMNVTFQP